MGCKTASTVELAQVKEPCALRRFPMVVIPPIARMSSPPAKIRFRMALQSRVGSWAFRRAATPVTWGVAMEVPLNVE